MGCLDCEANGTDSPNARAGTEGTTEPGVLGVVWVRKGEDVTEGGVLGGNLIVMARGVRGVECRDRESEGFRDCGLGW